MALFKSNRIRDIPEDAVVMDEAEALRYQMNIIHKWHNTRDVFAIKYGPYILGGAALLSGAFFNNHFRRKFFLHDYGRLSTYLPICLIPGFMATLFHTEFVLKDIILMNSDQCPVCLETKAAAIQTTISALFPMLLAPIGCATIAIRYGTYDVPYLHEKPMDAFKVFKKMFSRIQTKSLYLIIGQAFLGSVVTYFEASNLIKISKELERYDQSMFE